MNELYKLIQNIQAIVIANNEFAIAIDTKLQTIASKLEKIEKSMIIDTSEPTAVGTEE